MLGNTRNHYPYPITIRGRKAEADLTRDENSQVNWNLDANHVDVYVGCGRLVNHAGREFELARQQHSEISLAVVVPSCTETRALNGTNRILFDGRTLDVLSSYDRGENRDEVVILCAERRG